MSFQRRMRLQHCAEIFGKQELRTDKPMSSMTENGRYSVNIRMVELIRRRGEPYPPRDQSGGKFTNRLSRTGSETGKPNISVYFRSDNVVTGGLLYKRSSVREITAP